MRYAFVSDIHANLQGWQAVLADTRMQGVDEVVCLGDIVGYGPRPAETLQAVRAVCRRFTRGNHDAAAGGALELDLFNPEARRIVEWTQQQLDAEAIEFLGTMPFTHDIDCGDFQAVAVHSTMHPPEAFYYIFSEEDARLTWAASDTPLIFVGHTHDPKIDVVYADGTYECLRPDDFILEPGMRCIVNVGSVGLPRTADTRACYAIYDTEMYAVTWHRLAYDVAALTHDLETHAADLPEADWVAKAFDENDTTMIHEELDFSPPVVVKKRNLERARTRMMQTRVAPPDTARKTAKLIVAMGLLCVLVVGAMGYGLWYFQAKKEAKKDAGDATVEEPDKRQTNAQGNDKVVEAPPKDPTPVDPEPDPEPEPKPMPTLGPEVMVELVEDSFDDDPADKINTIAGVEVKSGKNLKLVLIISAKLQRSDVTATWKGGQTFKAAAVSFDRRYASVLYLDDPVPGTGDVVVSFPEQTRSRVALLSLSGSAKGVKTHVTGEGKVGEIDVKESNSLVVGAYTSDGDGTIESPVLKPAYNGDSGGSHGGGGYRVATVPGVKKIQWEDSKQSKNLHALVVLAPADKTADEDDEPPPEEPTTESTGEGDWWLTNKVEESKEYQLLYELDLAKLGRKIVYDVDHSGKIEGTPVRIAYFLLLKKKGDEWAKFVYVSMDAFTTDFDKMGIPVHGSGAKFQQSLKNLTVISNVKSLKTGTNIDGNIEFWPHNYNPRNDAKIDGASDQFFDTGDAPANNGDHGSMQIHNTKARQTIFAINEWKAGKGAAIGIGNSPSGKSGRAGKSRDWTFNGNASTYTVKRLKVLVKTKEP